MYEMNCALNTAKRIMVKYSHEVRRGDFDGGVSRSLRFCGDAGCRAVAAGGGEA